MIPAEAVEAAAKALYELGFGSWENAHADTRAVQMEDMRAALEAAAPYMLGPLLDDLRRERAKVELLLEGVE